jgi:hypothetical protein
MSGNNFPAPTTALAPSPRKRIIVGLPGTTFSHNFLICWTQTLAYFWQKGNYDVIVSPGQSSYVSFARAKTLGCDVRRGKTQKPFGGEPFDVFVTIDSDICWTPAQFETLVQQAEQYGVCSGYYMMQNGTHCAVVKDWDIEFFKKNATFQFLTLEDIKKNGEKPFKVSYAGMGFFAITKQVLDALTYPYFHQELQIIGTDETQLVDECSEDVAFCKNIQKAGYDIYLHPELRVGHEKQVIL